MESMLQGAKRAITGNLESPQYLAQSLDKKLQALKGEIASLPEEYRDRLCGTIEFSDEIDPIFLAQGLGGGEPLPQEVEAEMILILCDVFKTMERYLHDPKSFQSARVLTFYNEFNTKFREAKVGDLEKIISELVGNIKSIS